jgi:hypothetical protein
MTKWFRCILPTNSNLLAPVKTLAPLYRTSDIVHQTSYILHSWFEILSGSYTSTTLFGALGALGGTGAVGGGGGGTLGTACSLSGCTEGAAGAGGAGGAGGSGGTAFISTGGGGGGGTFSFFTCANTKQAEHMAMVAKEILFIIKWF